MKKNDQLQKYKRDDSEECPEETGDEKADGLIVTSQRDTSALKHKTSINMPNFGETKRISLFLVKDKGRIKNDWNNPKEFLHD